MRAPPSQYCRYVDDTAKEATLRVHGRDVDVDPVVADAPSVLLVERDDRDRDLLAVLPVVRDVQLEDRRVAHRPGAQHVVVEPGDRREEAGDGLLDRRSALHLVRVSEPQDAVSFRWEANAFASIRSTSA